jgi:NADH-quinone oxidoreductase subunit H
VTLDPLVVTIIVALIKSIVVIVVLLGAFAYLTLVERYVVAKIQSRVGPNRVGAFGGIAWQQPIAAAVTMIF